MRRVITVSLNGNAYQLEEDAHAALAAYVEQAARALADNPDQQEIIADLEQAIADKCARFLGTHKTVVTRVEIQQVITEMGPVDGSPAQAAGAADEEAAGAARAPGSAPGADPAAATGAANQPPPRRLYQISDGALISGVCNGLAAYFDVDVTLVRVIFVALVLLTGGAALLGYLLLMFVVPYANTSEEHAAAHGIPFNARVLVERAKEKYHQFASGAQWQQGRSGWRAELRRARAEWRRSSRHARRQWCRPGAYALGPLPMPPPPGIPPAPPLYGARVFAGAIVAVLGVGFAVFTFAWLAALLSLVTTGAIFGWSLPGNVPLWAALVGLVILYNLVAWPIKAARHAAYFPGSGYQHSWIAAWDGIVGLAVVATLAWYGYHHSEQVRELFSRLQELWNSTVHQSGTQA